jgi:uncharacterized protein YdaU (DUF1376 family)
MAFMDGGTEPVPTTGGGTGDEGAQRPGAEALWMPLYVADYLKDTQHLSAQENGAYWFLILHAWTRGGPLPKEDDRLARIARLTTKEWKASRGVILEFFSAAPDGYRHKRVDLELARADKKIEQRRAAGEASAAARAAQREQQREGQRGGNGRSAGVGTEPPANEQRNGRQSQSQVLPLPNGNGADPEGDSGKTLFDHGVRLLTAKGIAEGRARGIIAGWQRDFGDAAALEAMNHCRDATDPVSAVRARLGKAKKQAEYVGP